MVEPINLNKARKAKARKAKAQKAEENRIKFGRTKAQKAQDGFADARRQKRLDQTKREPDAPEDS